MCSTLRRLLRRPSPQPCRNFARGRSGVNCRFSHTTVPSGNTPTQAPNNSQSGSSRNHNLRCAFCMNKGHLVTDCRRKRRLAQLAAASASTTGATTLLAQAAPSSAPAPTPNTSLDDDDYNEDGQTSSFVFITEAEDKHTTNQEGHRQDHSSRRARQATQSVPHQLPHLSAVPLQAGVNALTQKGMIVHMTKDKIRMTNPNNDVVLLGLRDNGSQLFHVQVQVRRQILLFWRSPTNNRLLELQPPRVRIQTFCWKLHLRHGHRNFADLARQYNIPVPKPTPSCSSCVMGKAHQHPALVRESTPRRRFPFRFPGALLCANS